MHLLAYWRLDNYLRDLDEGAGFNFNSRQARLHTAIQPGETLWLFTVVKNPPRFFVVAKLVVRSGTMISSKAAAVCFNPLVMLGCLECHLPSPFVNSGRH